MADGAVLNPVYNSTDYSYTGTEYVDNNEYSISKTYNSSSGNYTDSYTYGKAYTPEGYVTTLSNPQYYYFRKDHLGNNREVWLANTGATVQRTQYYPSGLPWAESTGQDVQNKKYNGKEFVEAHGLDEYDSEARWYYPAIMRTTTLDPLAEKYYSISPYAWCGNNPVRMIDPDGMDWFYNDQTGAVVYVSNLYKGAEKGMEKGWQWMGENGMFSKDNDDILNTDDYLVNKYGGKEEYPFVINSQGKPERIISHVLELDGKKAKEFMNDMGYEQKPSETLVDYTERNLVGTLIPGGSVSVKDIHKDVVWLSLIYVQKNSKENSKIELLILLMDINLSIKKHILIHI